MAEICHRCRGSGLEPPLDASATTPRDDVGAVVAGYQQACVLAGITVTVDGLVDERAAATLIGYSLPTLRRWRTDGCPSGGIPFIQRGRHIMYRLIDLAKWSQGR